MITGAGTLFMVVAPLVYMVRGQLFVQDKSASGTEEREYQLRMTQIASAALTAFGIFLLLVWAFTFESNGVRILARKNNEEEGYFLTWGNGLRMVFEMIGRLMVTTILFSDIVLAMSICHWREERNLKANQRSEIDMFQLNTILFEASPVDYGRVDTADAGNVPPTASGTEHTQNGSGGRVDEVSSYGEEEDGVSV